MAFQHSQWPVYKRARELVRAVARLVRKTPRGRSDLVDQLRRAASSIPVNIAEGAGEYRPKERARFYKIARRSATECAGIMDSFVDNGLLREEDIEHPLALVDEIIAMLVALTKSIESDR